MREARGSEKADILWRTGFVEDNRSLTISGRIQIEFCTNRDHEDSEPCQMQIVPLEDQSLNDEKSVSAVFAAASGDIFE